MILREPLEIQATKHEDREAACAEIELLISKACDGECSRSELARLSAHLERCGDCRKTMEAYREIAVMLRAGTAAMPCPPAPSVGESRFGRRPITLERRISSWAKWGGVAACLLLFLAGHMVGFHRAARREGVTPPLSPVAVATPSMWMANREPGPATLANIESEQPFTDSIVRYRAAIGEELRRGEVDWMKVRSLVEAMGELRTDLELLTIHMAYLDIRTGSSPYEVAAHWEALAGGAERAVYRP